MEDNNESLIISALPFTYDSTDERITAILKQVVDFCGAEFPEVDPEDPSSQEAYDAAVATYWTKLWQVIRFVSNITCWTEQADDTFITQTRVQTFHIDQVCACRPMGCCHCDEDTVSIPLDFMPTPENPFVDGKITVFINGSPVQEDITAEYLNAHYDEANGRVYLVRSDFPDTLLYRGRCCCLCRRKATITLRYNAGYDLIPIGILPMICPILAKIDESKMSSSECANTMTQVSGLLRFKKVGNIQYQWSDNASDTQKTMTLYTELYNLANIAEIYAMSRCLIAEMPEMMGEVI